MAAWVLWEYFLLCILIHCKIQSVDSTCDDGKFGWECSFSCQCGDRDEVCDKVTGDCPQSGCARGKWGKGCLLEKRCYYELSNEKGKNYQGAVSRTKSGQKCLFWTSRHAQRLVRYQSSNFPDNSIQETRNYCRAPEEDSDGPKIPWCYFSNEYPYWEYCDIKKCDCPALKFGQNCEKQCHCRENIPCDKITGACDGQCVEGWSGIDCQTVQTHISDFHNVKVNPRIDHTNISCTITNNPRITGNDIFIGPESGQVITRQVITKETGLYNQTKILVDVDVNEGDRFICQYRQAQAIKKTITIQYHVLPELRDAPTFSQVTSSSVLLQWRKWNQDNIGDPPIQQYQIEKSSTSILSGFSYESVMLHSSCGTLCSYSVRRLNSGTTYYFRIIAKREGLFGSGSPSPVGEVKTLCDIPQLGPTLKYKDMKLQSSRQDGWKIKVTLMWQLPDPSTFGCNRIKMFEIFLHKSSSPAEEPIKVFEGPSPPTQHTVYGLDPYTRYEATVRFTNDNDFNSPFSDTLRFLTMEAKPSAPIYPRIESCNSTAITLSWQPPEYPNGDIRKYTVRYYKTLESPPQLKFLELRAPFSMLKYAIAPLESNTNFTIQVQAITNAGGEDWSAAVMGYTEEGVPEAPRSLRNTSRSSDSIILVWEPPINTNGLVVKYTVECTLIIAVATRDGLDVKIELAGDVYKHEFNKLRPGSSYICTVKASTTKGEGAEKGLRVWTLPVEPERPAVPEVMTADSTDTTVSLKLARVKNTRFYRIIVERVGSSRRKRRQSVAFKPDTPFVSYEIAHEQNLNQYIAAELEDSDWKEIFIVGDNKTYGEYYNSPLKKGEKYNIMYGAGDTVDGVSRFSYSKLEQPLVAQKYIAPSVGPSTGGDNGAIGGAIAIIVVLILIATLIAVVLVRRKRKREANLQQLKDEEMKETGENCALTAAVNKDNESDTEDDTTNLNTIIESEPLYTNVGEIRHSVPLDELEEYIKDMKIHKSEKFKQEYQQIPWGLTAPCEVAKKQENRHKNRYGNIVAYDHSRVILESIKGVPDSDYVNADYLDGYAQLNAYIATQGPSKPTVADFWRMVWQENAPKIVMVTNLVEDGRRKCELYWPEEGYKEYGTITVKIQTIEKLADFTVRTFEVAKDGQTKVVKQFHFTAWPDHGAPKDATPLLGFWRKVRSYETADSGPIVVHCSAGVGRSGTFIALDYLMDQADTESKVNVYALVKEMRTKRCNMIQTPEQYIFLHEALLEAVKSGNTCIPAGEFILEHASLTVVNAETKKAPIQEQFQLLRELICPQNMNRVKSALESNNKGKNRDPTIVPYNNCRPYLMTPVDDGSDYINAVFIDSYRNKDAFIVTQTPLPNTVLDFWRLLYDHHSNSIVMLNKLDIEDESMTVYWPDHPGTHIEYGPFTVELIAPPIGNSVCIVREFKLTYTRRPSDDPLIIKQFQLTCWQDNDDAVPESTAAVLDLVSMVDLWQLECKGGPVTVHCRNGAERSGLYVVCSYIVEKLIMDHEVDVFQVIKHICINRPQLITDLEQYKFCYNFVQEYLDRHGKNPKC